jgi:hypothetical protein
MRVNTQGLPAAYRPGTFRASGALLALPSGRLEGRQ